VAEVVRHVLGEGSEQRRTGAEQRVPVHRVGALAVAVVEAAGPHQVQRPAFVDPFDIGFPVDRLEHQARQFFVVGGGRGARQRCQLVAAGLEIFEQPGPVLAWLLVARPVLGGPFLGRAKPVVQPWRLGIPVDHQDRHGRVLAPRQQDRHV
jgi:hypothetical protein